LGQVTGCGEQVTGCGLQGAEASRSRGSSGRGSSGGAVEMEDGIPGTEAGCGSAVGLGMAFAAGRVH